MYHMAALIRIYEQNEMMIDTEKSHNPLFTVFRLHQSVIRTNSSGTSTFTCKRLGENLPELNNN